MALREQRRQRRVLHKLGGLQWEGGVRAANAKSPVIQRLASRIEVLIIAKEVGPRQLANVLWAFAKMFSACCDHARIG